jgi:hypothetical protein
MTNSVLGVTGVLVDRPARLNPQGVRPSEGQAASEGCLRLSASIYNRDCAKVEVLLFPELSRVSR